MPSHRPLPPTSSGAITHADSNSPPRPPPQTSSGARAYTDSSSTPHQTYQSSSAPTYADSYSHAPTETHQGSSAHPYAHPTQTTTPSESHTTTTTTNTELRLSPLPQTRLSMPFMGYHAVPILFSRNIHFPNNLVWEELAFSQHLRSPIRTTTQRTSPSLRTVASKTSLRLERGS